MINLFKFRLCIKSRHSKFYRHISDIISHISLKIHDNPTKRRYTEKSLKNTRDRTFNMLRVITSCFFSVLPISLRIVEISSLFGVHFSKAKLTVDVVCV